LTGVAYGNHLTRMQLTNQSSKTATKILTEVGNNNKRREHDRVAIVCVNEEESITRDGKTETSKS